MLKNIYLLTVLVMLTGCAHYGNMKGTSHDRPNESVDLKIDAKRIGDSLAVSYQITNVSQNDIWVCQDMYAWNNTECTIRFVGRDLKIEFRSYQSPCNIYLEEGVIAAYRKICPSEIIAGEVLLKLPVVEQMPHFDEPVTYECKTILSRLVFDVGYFTYDLAEFKDDMVSYKPGVAYINDLWHELLMEEKISTATIGQLEIDALMQFRK
jgi:hypothetical protein